MEYAYGEQQNSKADQILFAKQEDLRAGIEALSLHNLMPKDTPKKNSFSKI